MLSMCIVQGVKKYCSKCPHILCKKGEEIPELHHCGARCPLPWIMVPTCGSSVIDAQSLVLYWALDELLVYLYHLETMQDWLQMLWRTWCQSHLGGIPALGWTDHQSHCTHQQGPESRLWLLQVVGWPSGTAKSSQLAREPEPFNCLNTTARSHITINNNLVRVCLSWLRWPNGGKLCSSWAEIWAPSNVSQLGPSGWPNDSHFHPIWKLGLSWECCLALSYHHCLTTATRKCWCCFTGQLKFQVKRPQKPLMITTCTILQHISIASSRFSLVLY